ncbi:MAG: CpsD/CapB family tyrosine-protein kinase [Eubacterium sp.]|nr:CpsD/CapB family tyrosine-protein kinase [Eubacterium sp.]
MKRSIITYQSPKDPISESFRNMRTNITFSNIDQEMRVLTITSVGKGEGKSTIIANYAVALAQAKKKVVLLDCDLRRPRVHRLFDQPNRRGLTNVLLREAAITEAIQSTEVENLYLVSSGPIPPNPSEILASKRLEEVIEKLKEAFDYILIDAPPVGVVTDAAVLSKVTDGFIVVAAINVTNKEGIKLAIDTLKNVNANIVGVVANNAPLTKRSGYYYYYSAYEEDQPKGKKAKREKKIK